MSLVAIADADEPTIYQASVTVRDCLHTLRIGGVTLWHDDPSDLASTPINVWLRNGRNTLVIEARAEKPGEGCELEASLTSVGPDRGPQWRERASVSDTLRLTHRFDAAIDALGMLERRLVEGGDENAAKAFAIEFARAVDADTARAVELTQVKIEDYAAAYQHPQQALESDLRSALASMSGRVGAIDADRLVAEPLLERRIWRIRRRDHDSALIVIDDGDSKQTLDVFVGLTSDGWRVVR